MNVISFSLWGSNPKYTIGAIRNAELAQEIYPGWTCRFYTGTSVPKEITDQLASFKNVKIINKNEDQNWKGAYWRFYAGTDSDVAIFRDTDSRLSLREKYAVDEWLKSNKTVHIMRDHPYHNFAMLAGMWGYKNNGKYNLKELLDNFDKKDYYGNEYEFFSTALYPLIKDDAVVHDEFFEGKPFPSIRRNNQFVGQVFDENENTPIEHQNALNKVR